MCMSSGVTWAQVQAAILPWLPPIVTLAGWAVLNGQNNRRELRKEERALVDGAKKLVTEVSKTALEYMCAADRNEGAEADIKLTLDQVEIELGRLPRYESEGVLVTAMAQFADAATGGDFESHTKTAATRGDPGPQRLVLARNELLSKLEDLFSERYHR